MQLARRLKLASLVPRQRQGRLAAAEEAQGKRDLGDRDGDAERLHDQLALAQPAGGARRGDEPARVPCTPVARDAGREGLGPELGDRVARIDSLGAALVAEVTARALPDAVLAAEPLQPRRV